jgi:hypothetical protein
MVEAETPERGQRVSKTVCHLCDLVWSLTIVGACTYLVFWRNESGWWYVLAVLLASAWRCNTEGDLENQRE